MIQEAAPTPTPHAEPGALRRSRGRLSAWPRTRKVPLVEEARTYLTKAVESLTSAQINFAAARYNSCGNRAYYACFQAAIAALLAAGIRPASPRGEWSHEFVQSQFNGLLIIRRKLYPATLRRVLRDTMAVREKADYTPASVSARVASRVLQAAQEFVRDIQEKVR
jgi:uncharacterized protein (UPF0332 family)